MNAVLKCRPYLLNTLSSRFSLQKMNSQSHYIC